MLLTYVISKNESACLFLGHVFITKNPNSVQLMFS